MPPKGSNLIATSNIPCSKLDSFVPKDYLNHKIRYSIVSTLKPIVGIVVTTKSFPKIFLYLFLLTSTYTGSLSFLRHLGQASKFEILDAQRVF